LTKGIFVVCVIYFLANCIRKTIAVEINKQFDFLKTAHNNTEIEFNKQCDFGKLRIIILKIIFLIVKLLINIITDNNNKYPNSDDGSKRHQKLGEAVCKRRRITVVEDGWKV
jgi:H+/gluconate symporter-like permease